MRKAAPWALGDLFGDLDFLQAWETTFHYCAVDACGNDVSYSYSLTSTGELQDPLLDGGVEGEQDAEATYVKDLINHDTLPEPCFNTSRVDCGERRRI